MLRFFCTLSPSTPSPPLPSLQIFQSASLCLTTTTPEQLASALWWFMVPLRHIGVPVAEIILTLLLSLRFINLVFDEVSCRQGSKCCGIGIVLRTCWHGTTRSLPCCANVCRLKKIPMCVNV